MKYKQTRPVTPCALLFTSTSKNELLFKCGTKRKMLLNFKRRWRPSDCQLPKYRGKPEGRKNRFVRVSPEPARRRCWATDERLRQQIEELWMATCYLWMISSIIWQLRGNYLERRLPWRQLPADDGALVSRRDLFFSVTLEYCLCFDEKWPSLWNVLQ